MTPQDDTPNQDPNQDHGPDPVAAADPAPREQVARLPLSEARAALREEILASGAPGRRASTEATPARRRWVPALAAAAVAAVAGGAWWALAAGDDAGPPERRAASDRTSAAVSRSAEASSSPYVDSSAAKPEQPSTRPAGPKERFMMPPRPLLLTAPGWRPDVVRGENVTWVGPGGGRIEVRFFAYTNPEDPFAYGDYPPGEEIQALEERTRLTAFRAGGARHLLAITSPVIDEDGTAVTLEATGLTRAEFRRVLDSGEWVNLRRYDRVVKPAVG